MCLLLNYLYIGFWVLCIPYMQTLSQGQILSLSHFEDEMTCERPREYKLQVDWVLVIANCFVDHRFWSNVSVV